jgi:hypothetical protein
MLVDAFSSPLVVVVVAAASLLDMRATTEDVDGTDGWYRRVNVRAVSPATAARMLMKFFWNCKSASCCCCCC